MRYLKRFNESATNEIVNDCKDILIDFTDNGYFIDSYLKSNTLIVEIGERESKMIKLQDFGEPLERLFYYLSSEGYSLTGKSYVQNDNWDANTQCPECGSESIVTIDTGDEFLSTCKKCGYSDDNSNFLDFRHRVDESDIKYFVKHKYWVQYMYLVFEKK